MSGKKGKKIAASSQQNRAIAVSDSKKITLSFLTWAPTAILLFTALIYLRAIQNGLTSFDDDFYIVKNPFLRDFSFHGVVAIFSSFYQSNYHPLTTLTYLIEFHFFGLNPLPYHVANVVLHLICTLLVYKCCEKLSGSGLTAMVVSILFAIHPMHVESVAWVSERKDVLYAAFYLLSLNAYLQYIENGQTKKYILTLLFFIASLLSKAAAVTLPVLLIAVDVYKGRDISKKTLMEKAPLLLLSLLFGIINIFAQKAGGPVDVLLLYYGVINGIFLFTSGIALYIIRSVVPFDLSAMHYFPYINGSGLPLTYYLSLPFLILIAWIIIRLKKDNPLRKEVLFGISFFIIVISVMLQLITVGSALTAERYTYLSYIGFFYIAGQLITSVIEQKKHSQIAIGIFCLVIVIYAIQTWNRIAVWKDDEVLLTDVIDKNPGILDLNYIYLLRGDSRINNRDLKGALDDFNQAITMTPKFKFAGSAYFGRGHVYEEMGDLKSAMRDYDSTIALNPKVAEAYNSRGWLYFNAGDVKSAMQEYNTAISLKPDYAEAYNNRGWAYNNTGNLPAALQDYDKAIALAPLFEKPYFNRAAIKATSGDFPAALRDYDHLVDLYPNDNGAYYYRGLVRMNMRNNTGACEDWKRSSELGNQKAMQLMQQYCR